jgi:SlyX protein
MCGRGPQGCARIGLCAPLGAMEALMEDRLRELEIKFTYQEQLLETLNQVVIEQGNQLDRLRKQLAQHAERLSAAAVTEEPANERPPHY